MNDLSVLPPYHSYPVEDYGVIDEDDLKVMVIHFTAGVWPSDGSNTAAYCKTNPHGARWHWTVGNDGTVWRHLDWHEVGAHDAGINSISNGIEHCGSYETPWKSYPAQQTSSALITASFCLFTDQEPDRNFIIGHVEDGLSTRAYSSGTFTNWGGDSTHGDGGKEWPWPEYMAQVETIYEEVIDMGLSKDEKARLLATSEQVAQFFAGAGLALKGEKGPGWKDHPEQAVGFRLTKAATKAIGES